MWLELRLQLDYFSLTRLKESVQQYSLNLELPVKSKITKEVLTAAREKYGSATSCARALNCSVNTVLVLMEKYDLAPKRKPKKLNISLIAQVLEEASKGFTTAQSARNLGLSISTIGRIKRAYMSRNNDCM
jgi:transcriptional regulator with GAF, ATPase, and Fis domain